MLDKQTGTDPLSSTFITSN